MVVGGMGAIVQGGLVRVLVPRLGEARALVVGLSVGALAMTLYGSATAGWMMYAIIVAGSVGGISMPASQALVSRAVGPKEQGTVMGALSGLFGLTGILGPLVASQLFGYFISDAAPVKVPGAAFYLGAALMFAGVMFARRAARLLPAATASTYTTTTTTTSTSAG
jgi:DHA1 family tetracycline resistance protein-like MFS transporter